MRCRTAKRLLSRRIDGMLRGREVEVLGSHLADCDACRTEAGRIEKGWTAIARLEDPGPAPDDWQRIEAGAERAGRRASLLVRWRLAPIPVAGLVVAAMAGLGIVVGVVVSRVANAPARDGFEAAALSSALGDLPWGSPAAGLDRVPHGVPLTRQENP